MLLKQKFFILSTMIDIQNVTLQIADKELLDNASLFVPDGQKIGIVGSNGCGKSTLFKAILSQIEVTGDILISSYDRLVYVEQEIEDTEQTVFDYVLHKDRYLTKTQQEYENAPDDKKPLFYDELERLGVSTAPARIATVLKGLGFSEADFNKKVGAFSGGWQMRLNLAGALFQPSTILLLDEPTNHLDLESVLWLTDYLKKYKGTLLLISHDKNILNEICSGIGVFQNKKIVFYTGNYETYLKTKALQDKVLIRQAEKEREKREHLMRFINRFRYKASKAKQAQSRIKMLEKMNETPEVYLEAEERFAFLEPKEAETPFLKCENVVLGYGEKRVLNRLTLNIYEEERIALLGRNGNGKSTLAKFLAGVLPQMEGAVFRSQKLVIGYFSQHQEDELPLEETPVLYFKTLMNEPNETAVRSYLATFGLKGDKALTEIKKLSGGEKTRLLFAKIALARPNLLILDEPTNHLDILGREALASALNTYQGSVVLITHDFNLIEAVADTLLLVDKGRCEAYTGDMTDYKNYLLAEREKETELPHKKLKEETVSIRQNSALKRKLKAELLEIEREMARLNADKTALEKRYQSPLTPEEILSVSEKVKKIEKELDVLEEKWFPLYEKINN